MQKIEAKIVVQSLLQRVERAGDGGGKLLGPLTQTELEALEYALAILGEVKSGSDVPPSETGPTLADGAGASIGGSERETFDVALDLSVLSLEPPPQDTRICLDFGTAMSKATLVKDESDDPEEIAVLPLGEAADQEKSPNMLVSSVYIDNSGLLWFGQASVDHHEVESIDGSRVRIDNIKRRISEGGMDSKVAEKFNPTGNEVTYGDLVLSYLMFLSWTVTKCLDAMDCPRNLARRFAMPCFSPREAREKQQLLRRLLGEAQVLSDTFSDSFVNGIPLVEFLAAVRSLRSEPRSYEFIADDVTEPLGVAGSLVSWKSQVNHLMMVIDVGAGTTDFSLYRFNLMPGTNNNAALEIHGSARGIQEAGNYLDLLLREFILKKAGIDSQHVLWERARDNLEMGIRDYKETLFNEGLVFIYELDGELEVEITLEEFLALDAVCKFSDSLRTTMVNILEAIDPSWTNWIRQHPARYLVVVLTGGGAGLPMVQTLAEGVVTVSGHDVRVQKALTPPKWINDDYEDIADDYARIAVSLGGARRRLIARGTAHITADAGVLPPELGGFFLRGD